MLVSGGQPQTRVTKFVKFEKMLKKFWQERRRRWSHEKSFIVIREAAVGKYTKPTYRDAKT